MKDLLPLLPSLSLPAEQVQQVQLHLQLHGGNTWTALHESGIAEQKVYQALAERVQMPFLENNGQIRTLVAHLCERQFALQHQIIPQGRLAFSVRHLTYNPWVDPQVVAGTHEGAFLSLVTPSHFKTLFQVAYPRLRDQPYTLEECISLKGLIPLDDVHRWTAEFEGNHNLFVERGLLSDENLAAARSMESGHDHADPFVDPPEAGALAQVGIDHMVFFKAIPYQLKGGFLRLLMGNPHDQEVRTAFARMTQMPVKPVVASQQKIDKFIEGLTVKAHVEAV